MNVFKFMILAFLIAALIEKPYSPEKATQNGDIVNLHGKYSNLDVWDRFLNNLETKKAYAVRITQYSVEGDPIFYELIFDGKKIEYTFDNSMDAFGGQGTGRQTTVCTGVHKKTFESIGEAYILSSCESSAIGDTFHFRGKATE